MHANDGPADGKRGPLARQPTVADVAREAGVSVATTGRVLGNYGNVRGELREKVRAAADRLGYSVNAVARSMRSGSSRTIAFVGVDISNPFFAAAMRGLSDVARREGYEPILANTDDRHDTERAAVRVILEKQVEGIVISPTSVIEVDHLRVALERGLAVVLLDRHSSALDVDAVVIDNEQAARSAVEHLLALGHRDIALLASVYEHEGPTLSRDPVTGRVTVHGAARPSVDRIRGYVSALQDHGIVPDEKLIRYPPLGQLTYQDAEELLGAHPHPTAVFATDDFVTQLAFRAARRLGRVIPDDLSLVGFDDLDWTTLVDPPLTVVAQSPLDMGRLAGERLFKRIRGSEEPAQLCVVPTELLVRASTLPVT